VEDPGVVMGVGSIAILRFSKFTIGTAIGPTMTWIISRFYAQPAIKLNIIVRGMGCFQEIRVAGFEPAKSQNQNLVA